MPVQVAMALGRKHGFDPAVLCPWAMSPSLSGKLIAQEDA